MGSSSVLILMQPDRSPGDDSQPMFVYRNLCVLLFVQCSKLICSVGNILVLRGNIEILPPERTTVSYELLSQLVGEYLLNCSPNVDISAALSIMPLTQSWSH